MSIIGHQRETTETGPKQDWLPQQEHVNFIRILWSLTCRAPLWMTRGVLAVVVAAPTTTKMPPVAGTMSASLFGQLNDSGQETYGGASYRSVAFGTWKVGEARRFTAERFAKRHRTPDSVNTRANCQRDKPIASPDRAHRPDSHKSQPKLNTPNPDLPSEPQSSKSQPCTPAASKRPLKKQAQLAEQDEESEEMTVNGDCYSSTEYVQFASARGAYENVQVGQSPLQRQSLLLNRSMDALNERIVHYAGGQQFATADPRLLAHYDPRQQYDTRLLTQYDSRLLPSYDHQVPETSRNGHFSETLRNGQLRGTLGRNWRVRTPVVMPREFVVDPGPVYGVQGAYVERRDVGEARRLRAKSLDNANRISTTAPKKRPGSRQPEPNDSRSALQSAKNFLRRLYNTSTLRLRRNGRKMEAEERFKMAMAPFYEPRRPDLNERPYLPYNIRYEVEDEEDEGAIYDSHVLSTPASSASSAANQSPDEGIDGMFSVEDSGASTASARSSAVSAMPRVNYVQRPGSGLSSSTVASSSGLNSSTGLNSSAFSNGYGQIESNVYTVQSPRRQAPLLVEKFRNWNELFEHLKKEMNEIRARDNQILQDLKKIEEEVQVAKQTAAI